MTNHHGGIEKTKMLQCKYFTMEKDSFEDEMRICKWADLHECPPMMVRYTTPHRCGKCEVWEAKFS